MTAPERPPVFRGIVKGGGVRFRYTFTDATVGVISGRAVSILTRDGAVSGLRVQLDATLASDVAQQAVIVEARAKDPVRPVADFALGGIHPDPDTGLIVPVSRREMAAGTGAGAYVRASGARVELAVALARNGEGVPGFPALRAEGEFASMTRAQIDAWIDEAASAMEAQAARRAAARQAGAAGTVFEPGDQVVSIWFEGAGTVEELEEDGCLVRTADGTTWQPSEQLRHGTGPLVMATVSGPRIAVSARRDGDVVNLAVIKASVIRRVPLTDAWLDQPVADTALAGAGWQRTEDWTESDTDMWSATVTPRVAAGGEGKDPLS
jgi:hypothetical protein